MVGQFFSKGSYPFQWSWDDTLTIAKGAGIAAAGAIAAYLGNQSFDLTTTQGIITGAIASVVVNLLRKWATNTKS